MGGKIGIQKRAALYFFNFGANLRHGLSFARKQVWAKEWAKNRLKIESTWPIFELDLKHLSALLYELYSDPTIKSF